MKSTYGMAPTLREVWWVCALVALAFFAVQAGIRAWKGVLVGLSRKIPILSLLASLACSVSFYWVGATLSWNARWLSGTPFLVAYILLLQGVLVVPSLFFIELVLLVETLVFVRGRAEQLAWHAAGLVACVAWGVAWWGAEALGLLGGS